MPKGSMKPAAKPGLTIKTANWQGLPGKASPDRSAGVKKAQVSPKSTLC